MSQTGSRDGGVLGSLPIKRGAPAGVGAFVVGYVLTYLLKSGDIKDKMPDEGIMIQDRYIHEVPITFSHIGGVDPPGVVQVVSWLFYEMHKVNMGGTLSYTTAYEGEGETIEYPLLLGVEVETYMMLIPPLLLAAAGYWVVSSIAVNNESEAAKAGATVAVGYFVTAVLGALIFAYNDLNTKTLVPVDGSGGKLEETIELAFSVDLQSAAIIAGVVYPLVFGALGGYVAYRR